MENKRMTKKDYFAILADLVRNSDADNAGELVEFINHEVELLSKKRVNKGNSKKDLENEAIMQAMYEALLEFGRPVTVSELMTKIAYSNQKLSALLRKMVDMGKVEKTEDKRKSYFSAIAD